MVITSPLKLLADPSVMIQGIASDVTFAGVTGAGLDQINVTLPALPAGSTGVVDVAVTGAAGGAITQPGLFITMQSGN
jgi:uncharacterized protein (TIGR03437 family)